MSFEVKQVDVSGTGYPISTASVVVGHLSHNDNPPWASFDYFPHELFPGLLPNCSTCPLHPELSQLRAESAYWRQMHQKAVARESRHKEEIAALKAKLRLRESQLFARKSEKNRNRPDLTITAVDTGNQPRGQQPGSQGHGRRSYSHLPTRVEVGDIPENNRYCPICDRPWVYSGSEDSETIEIEVSAYRRCYQRRRYRRTCTCQPLPQTVTAPAPAKLIPKGILGISVWVTILLDKFRFMRPTYRLLADLKTRGLDLALGTVTGGLQALAPLFSPLYEAIANQHLTENRWQADETRWAVFIDQEGKRGHRWYLWVFHSATSVVYKLDPSRSAQVPRDHFRQAPPGILTVDRYTAYKSMAKGTEITLSFCWSHVRRDFINAADSWSQLKDWALTWLSDIGRIYYLNGQRLAVLDQPQVFEPRDCQLRLAIEGMAQQRDAELHEPNLHPARRKVLKSLQNHWPGLTVFLDHPEVPMDNNKSERLVRNPVVGRKNFYGSGSLWSGQLAATLFSIFETLSLWKLNPRLWLQAYLEACATLQGQAPENCLEFLPWKLSEAQRQAWALEPARQDSS